MAMQKHLCQCYGYVNVNGYVNIFDHSGSIAISSRWNEHTEVSSCQWLSNIGNFAAISRSFSVNVKRYATVVVVMVLLFLANKSTTKKLPWWLYITYNISIIQPQASNAGGSGGGRSISCVLN